MTSNSSPHHRSRSPPCVYTCVAGKKTKRCSAWPEKESLIAWVGVVWLWSKPRRRDRTITRRCWQQTAIRWDASLALSTDQAVEDRKPASLCLALIWRFVASLWRLLREGGASVSGFHHRSSSFSFYSVYSTAFLSVLLRMCVRVRVFFLFLVNRRWDLL